VVVAGLGDTGLLTAIHLAGRCDVVGVSSKPGLVSGQEVGNRISRPSSWAQDYWISFDRYRRLDRARVVHGTLVAADLEGRTVTANDAGGASVVLPYDVLVVSTGVRNGFWRRPDLESTAQIGDALRTTHARVAQASSVVVIGGGAAAVGCAFSIATTWPDKQVDLYFPGDGALPQHHPRVWRTMKDKLRGAGVGLHPGHRAVVPDGFDADRITDEPVQWTTGQEPVGAEAVIWAIGRVRPNTGWLPAELLDEQGFVRVEPDLRVVGQTGVFAVGDVAATDPLRTSARNRADKLLARNIRAYLAGRPLRRYRPPRGRWGSVVGIQADGLQVFAPTGQAFRIPGWTIRVMLEGLIVRRGIYRGVRRGPASIVPPALTPGESLRAVTDRRA
jgi:apoptosis-inducing factor 2